MNGNSPPSRRTWGNGALAVGVFRCAEDEMMLMVGNDGQFARACAALEAPELATNPKPLKNEDRVTHASGGAAR